MAQPLSVSGDFQDFNYQQQQVQPHQQPQQTWQRQPASPSSSGRCNIPKLPLQGIILVYFVLTVWGGQNFLPASYLIANFFIIFLGMWAVIDEKNAEAPRMMLHMLLVSILQDIIAISIFYTALHHSLTGSIRFSAGMAILNLLFKPLYCLFIYPHVTERGGSFLGPYLTCCRKNYDSIDAGCQPGAQAGATATEAPQGNVGPSPYQDSYTPYAPPPMPPTLPEYATATDTKPSVA